MPKKKSQKNPPSRKVTVGHSKKRSEFFLPLAGIVLMSFVGMGYFYNSSQPEKQAVLAQAVVEETPKPVFRGIGEIPVLTARGVYAFDVDSGVELFSKNAEDPLLPASTTKIATALVAMETYKPGDVLTVSGTNNVFGQKMGLYTGERISAEALIYGTLIHSANDAATALAASYPGGRGEFINAMNQLASDWGLSKTHFTNPVGFDEYLHFSTARDLAMLARLAMEEPKFAQIVGLQSAVVTSFDGRTVHRLTNTNQLLGSVPGVVGIKTGHTITSGESLVTRTDRDGHKVLIALVGSTNRFGETRALIDWIFASYVWEKEEISQK
ncbi:MAG: hypothetical protein A3A58_02200 [Candidatus Blackburnbacteria bacterium RIFCSPLOWO2_01_FULL_41_27]|uniref:Peptidase S11 D-alanyl-D-alanine carboxypeptidase A N-terminal domain-containing protein n=2 Tax=Candidatus Blackburniibacteriota TaxID=1817898 RepID=A0A1G1VB71_9BACT|nr:MAG: hypothetical protein A3F61_01445 [Candidatus Blackburnbacteria bacterium RIFCSPHIGHO2_12_FULL_41_13b]OGY13783.1 MAG: hypothetical protein A3A58_02200 [Candidatus Blackburnbacteria bacterium RIFCSPLOWO2_01_FULL_41_27]